MTTKYKIIAGFLLMVLLQGGLALLGYGNLGKMSQGFIEYRRLADFNVEASDLISSMYKAASGVFAFLDSRDPSYITDALKALDEADKQHSAAVKLVESAERRQMLAAINVDLKTYRGLVERVGKAILDAYKQFTDVVLPNEQIVAKRLMDLSQQAQSVNNTTALFAISTMWESFSAANSHVSSFAVTRSPEDAAKSSGRLADARAAMQKLGATLTTEGGRKNFAEVVKAFDNLNAAFDFMNSQNKTAEQIRVEMGSVRRQMTGKTITLNESVDTGARAFGNAMLQNNEDSQQYILVVSGVSLLLGIVCALFIVYGIVRVLQDMARFAGSVARGDFNYTIKVREKGEIGSMIEAMRQIPTVLERVMVQASTLAGAITCGHFRNRIEAAEFPGSFGNLALAVNTVGESYTKVLDYLPVPIMACSKSNSIIFLNKAAQDTVGGNHINSPCSSQVKGDVCDNDKCFGNRAMSSGSPHVDEAAITPGGTRMDVSMTAIPLHDADNAVVGYIEIITDLTEVKAKQTTMLQVAKDASDISDRVAAASEQLAAQVEQISRGAEMQRSRVESTASAMTQMNATVMEVARSASEASEQSEDTRQKAQNGSELVNKVVGSINTVNAVAATLHSNMQELGKQAESIGGVMNVISDIADQTNLLALNAAIEAARAGEAGRGFAVVADEVRKLAEKTMAATQEVGSSITAVQNSARTNIEEVGNAVKSIEEATALADSSGLALKEIVHLAAANSAVVTSIATAAEEQSATSEEINRAIDEINRVVGETTEGMVQSSAAVQDLSQMAQELRSVMDGLK